MITARDVFLLTSLLTAVVGRAAGQLTDRQRADLVVTLLPEPARAGATIVLRRPEGDSIRRQGQGPFVCISDVSHPGRLSFLCHHRVLDRQLDLERELRRNGVTGADFRLRRCEEARARNIEVPNGAMEIMASLAVDSTGTLADEMTVYHLLWLPHATGASSGVVEVDPGQGAPFLHQAGSCGAHVMWSEVRRVSIGS